MPSFPRYWCSRCPPWLPGATGWGAALLLLLAVSLGFGVVFAWCTEPEHRAYLHYAGELEPTDRARAAQAVRTGRGDDNPEVLAAAARLHAAMRNPAAPQRFPWRTYLVILLATAVACVIYLVRGEPRLGAVWGCYAAVVAVAWWVRHRRYPELVRNARAFRSIVDERLPGGFDTVAAETPSVWSTARRARRQGAVAGVILLVAVGAALMVAIRPSADCRTVNAAVGYIADRPELFDAAALESGGNTTPLSEFQQWADQLRDHANAVSDPAVAPHLRRIAELSGQVVTVVSSARMGSVDEEKAITLFHDRLQGIVDEENAALAVCRRG